MSADDMDDGAWVLLYFMIDCIVALLEVSFAIFMVCIEIACWAIAGGFDILFSMMGFGDDD